MSSTLRDPRCRRTICARRYPRALFSIPIKLRHLVTGGVQTSRGITLDISEGGLGALVQGDLRPGETVELDLSLPEQALSAVAIVRHSSQVRSGFEFLGLTAEERGRLTAFCARQTSHATITPVKPQVGILCTRQCAESLAVPLNNSRGTGPRD
jgi:hypothetical protein